MNKKAAVGVLIIFFFLTVFAYAKPSQPPPNKPLTADDIVAKMKVQLQLSDKQIEEIKPIIKDHLAKEQQLKLEEKKQLAKVLTGQQLYTWNFLQNEPPKEKKKHSAP